MRTGPLLCAITRARRRDRVEAQGSRIGFLRYFKTPSTTTQPQAKTKTIVRACLSISVASISPRVFHLPYPDHEGRFIWQTELVRYKFVTPS